MRVLARNCLRIAAGQLKLIGKAVRWHHGPNASISPSSHLAHQPMRQSRAEAHCVPDGPMRANCLGTMMHEMGQCELIV